MGDFWERERREKGIPIVTDLTLEESEKGEGRKEGGNKLNIGTGKNSRLRVMRRKMVIEGR